MIPMERKFLLEVMQEIFIIPVRLASARVNARHVGAMALLTVIIPEAVWPALIVGQMWVNAQCVAELAKNTVSNDNSSLHHNKKFEL